MSLLKVSTINHGWVLINPDQVTMICQKEKITRIDLADGQSLELNLPIERVQEIWENRNGSL
jgi:hypothetical protein